MAVRKNLVRHLRRELMEKIISVFFAFSLLLGCENPDSSKSFVRYVDYSGMMLSNLNTVSIPDSQIVLDLGKLCVGENKLRYSHHGKHRNDTLQYFKNTCFEVTHGCETLRNYLDSVPEKIKNAMIDTLLLNSNEIKYVPPWLCQKNIKHIDLSNNKIQDFSIPQDCFVESIDLRQNHLSEIPNGIFECKTLKRLYLDKNLKKHKVKTDTILVYGKTLVFGNGMGDLSLEEFLNRPRGSQYPNAIQLEEW